jgi:23S rRNA (cytidine1920-2'-O)/16S rRNA (cytidine1409-2'-O)-methyltransferase
MPRIRLDTLLVERALVRSRDRARALIMAGRVLVGDEPVTKPGTAVDAGADLRLRGEDHPFVSRGGLKLEGALDDLGLDVAGKTILDVGASTGGFTDCCLKRGAVRAFCVDVGTNQLDWSLRSDPRVAVLEQTNARHLSPADLPGPADLAVIDVSFISLTLILEPVLGCLTPDGAVLAMIKPQFEAGRGQVGKGGVVRDPGIRERAVQSVIGFAAGLGLAMIGRADSKVPGPKGNVEVFVHFERGGADAGRARG